MSPWISELITGCGREAAAIMMAATVEIAGLE
jgi:hypothetical protein